MRVIRMPLDHGNTPNWTSQSTLCERVEQTRSADPVFIALQLAHKKQITAGIKARMIPTIGDHFQLLRVTSLTSSFRASCDFNHSSSQIHDCIISHLQ